MSTSTTTRPSFLRSLSAQSFKIQHDKPRLYIALYPRGGALFYNISHCDSYHWCLLVAPASARKSEAGKRFSVVHTSGGGRGSVSGIARGQASSARKDGTRGRAEDPAWDSNGVYEGEGVKYFYEEQDFSEPTAQGILVRVTVAKVTDQERLEGILRDSSLGGTNQKRNREKEWEESDGGMNCLRWVKEKYCEILRDGKCVKGFVYEDDWRDIEDVCRRYVRRKRNLGRWRGDGDVGPWDRECVPTWNFWENRETTP